MNYKIVVVNNFKFSPLPAKFPFAPTNHIIHLKYVLSNTLFNINEKYIHSLRICNTSFNNSVQFTGSSHSSTPGYLVCPVCCKCFRHKNSLRNHYRHKHNEPKELFCELCSRKFVWANELSNHMDSVHNVKKEYECGYCGRYFHYNARAISHIQSIHRGNDVRIKHHPQFRKQ